MALDLHTLRHVARLARLKLTPEEERTYLAQLSSVFSYFAKLEQVDTTAVEPTHQVTALPNVFRPDEPKTSLSSTEALSGASNTKRSYLMAPTTIKK